MPEYAIHARTLCEIPLVNKYYKGGFMYESVKKLRRFCQGKTNCFKCPFYRSIYDDDSPKLHSCYLGVSPGKWELIKIRNRLKSKVLQRSRSTQQLKSAISAIRGAMRIKSLWEPSGEYENVTEAQALNTMRTNFLEVLKQTDI